MIHVERGFHGRIALPGDRIITTNAMILGAIADGETELINPCNDAAVKRLGHILGEMGARIKIDSGSMRIKGHGFRALRKPKDGIHLERDSYCACLLTGLLSPQFFNSAITVSGSALAQPEEVFFKTLRKAGAVIRCLAEPDHFPIMIHGSGLKGTRFVNADSSVEIKAAMLLAGLYAEGKTSIYEANRSNDHMEHLLETFGAPIACQQMADPKGRTFCESVGLSPCTALSSCSVSIPGDTTLASYLAAGALITTGSDLLLENVCLNPTRTYFLELYKKAGGNIEFLNVETKNGEPRGDIRILSSEFKGITVREYELPQLYFELPLIALLGTRGHGPTIIHKVSSLPYEPAKRLQLSCNCLKDLGAHINLIGNDIIIEGRYKLHGAATDCENDPLTSLMLEVLQPSLSESVSFEKNCIKSIWSDYEKSLNTLLK